MYIKKYNNEEGIIKYFENNKWGSGKFLGKMMRENTLLDNLGEFVNIYLLYNDDNEIVSYCTLSEQDCIKDKSMIPWIGFVYTESFARGKRYSLLVIKEALKEALKFGYDKVYLATTHIGLYERYGFYYLKNQIDFENDDCRIYVYDLKEIE